jgi:hypothetical protein
MNRRLGRIQPYPGGARIFQRVFTRLGCAGRPPHFVVEFFPYANLTNTIRLREEFAYVRLSDLMRGAPLTVIEGVAAVLLSRVYRRRMPRGIDIPYREYLLAGATRRRIARVRRLRATPAAAGPASRHRNLAQLFARLNREYFQGKLRQPHLVWSARPWRSQCGYYDAPLGQMVINSRLDSPRVPACVLQYVLYHEMLHIKHPVRRAACGLQSHSPQFRREERLFRDYERARRWLARLS